MRRVPGTLSAVLPLLIRDFLSLDVLEADTSSVELSLCNLQLSLELLDGERLVRRVDALDSVHVRFTWDRRGGEGRSVVWVERTATGRLVEGFLVVGENGPRLAANSLTVLGCGGFALDRVALLLGLVDALEAARLSTPETVGLICVMSVSGFEWLIMLRIVESPMAKVSVVCNRVFELTLLALLQHTSLVDLVVTSVATLLAPGILWLDQLLKVGVDRRFLRRRFGGDVLKTWVLILVLDLLDVTQTSPWMLRLVQSDLGAQISLELGKVSVLEARDSLQVLEELNAPVARIILRLILDVVTLLAVPGAHADVLWDDLNGIVDLEGSC
jgi:hypothetical protein